MRVIVPLVIDEHGVIVYPVDISLVSNSVISDDGKSIIFDYSGDEDEKDLPVYNPPAPKPRRIVSTLQFYTLLPQRLEVMLANPDMVLPDMVKYAALKVFDNRIKCSQVVDAGGITFGVDLEDEMTREGFQEAIHLGMATQEEVDAVFFVSHSDI